MGACSSKPKTTEFEGSIAPSKQTEDATADQPQAMERSLEKPVSEHVKELPSEAGKLEEKVAHATTKAVQSERELDVSKEEGPPAGSNLEVLGVKEAVKTEANDGVEKIGGGGGNEVGHVGSAVADNSSADDKTDVDSAVADKVGRDEEGIKANVDEMVVDETKTCEDKVVVLEETGTSHVDAPYVDKTVALNEEKPAETKMSSDAPDKRSLVVPEEDVSDVLDSTESRGVESPIAGLVQPLELTKHGNVSEGVDTEPEKDRVDEVVDADAPDDFKLVHEGFPSDSGDEDVHISAKAVDARVDVNSSVALDLQRDVVEPPGEASFEVFKGSGAEMLAPAEGDSLKDPDEAAFQLQVEAASDAIDSAIHSITDSQVAVKECSRDTEPSGPLDEIAINSVTHKGEGSVDDSALEAPRITDIIDSKTSTIEPSADDIAEESVQEVGGPVVQDNDVNVGQAQALVFEEPAEDGKPKDTLDQNTTEGERKSEEALAITTEVGKDAARTPQLEHSTSVDATFEDASDVPLKVEASK